MKSFILAALLDFVLFSSGLANPAFGRHSHSHQSHQHSHHPRPQVSATSGDTNIGNSTLKFSLGTSKSLTTYEPHSQTSDASIAQAISTGSPSSPEYNSLSTRTQAQIPGRPSTIGSLTITHTSTTNSSSLNTYPQVSGSPSNITKSNSTYAYALNHTSSSQVPAQTSGVHSKLTSAIGKWNWPFKNVSFIEPAPPRVIEDLFFPSESDKNWILSGDNVTSNGNLSASNGTWANSTQDVISHGSVSDHASFRLAAVVGKLKFVFAHFMVGNVPSWKSDDWKSDIRKAQAAHIDAFALNMAADDPNNRNSLGQAFAAADSLGFKLVFSFDYAGGGPWDKAVVLEYIRAYTTRSSYYFYNGKAFMSTFEGWENAADWVDIKKQGNCVFLPDWSSRGAKDAMLLAGGVADGLFSWAAWPWGNTDMNTYVDASYDEFLKGKLYMMPVSPWFFTNMPGYDGKNWIWRGDSLWHDRWAQTLVVQPHFVQIISWNDYGESHYIGPLDDRAYGAFETGLAPYNYVLDMPHDGWREILPFAIDLYKYNTTSFTKEVLVTWYRKHPAAACSTGGTSGSTASQLLLEFPPSAVAQDMIFYSALLASDATVVVTIGGVNVGASFQDKPSGGIGLYHGSVATSGRTGAVSVSISRSTGSLVVNGKSITTSCQNGLQNWNAWVGSATGPTIASKSPTLAVDKMECISGTGAGIFAEICGFTCAFGYCPLGACQCMALGKPAPKPASTGIKGYPAKGMSASFVGLCNFACNLGKCPSNVCGTVQILPYTIFTSSPFLPPACTAGTAVGMWAGLCSYACDFGYCPMSVCTCTRTGVLNPPPAANMDNIAYPISGEDGGLCKFACTRTWCPADVCEKEPDEYEYEFIDPKDYLGPCTDTYDSIDAIERAGTNIPFHCLGKYIVTVQAKELGTAISDYQAIIAAGYDDKFKIYSRYISELVWPSIKAFMEGDGWKYLTCTEKITRICCSDCTNAGCRDPANCEASPCVGIGGQKSIACPKKITTVGDLSSPPPAYTFSFNNKATFFTEFSDKFGISESWTQIADHKAYVNAGCQGNVPACYIVWQNMILPAATITVPNPKQVFETSLNSLKSLRATLIDAAVPEGLQFYAESTSDVADAAAMPVAMSANAVTLMRAVVEKADKIEDEERKNTILLFVTSFLMFIPVVGTGAAGVGFVTLGNIIRMAGFAADTALGIWGIVQDPKSAIFVIFAAVIGARDFTKAAGKRNSMSDDDLNALGPNVAGTMRRVDNVKKDFYCKM